ncbi:spermidine synthase [Streptomyces sp. NPDC057702]|uniref:spermidine synthase n=1 Tax=unclassified Streptomyces TaxID=2593676 RepID=UPI0036D0DEC6
MEAGTRPASSGAIAGPVVLIGGLGVGFSLIEAVADPRWGRIVVAEREEAVIDWHLHGPLGALTGPALADPRTEILHTDLVAYLRGSSPAPAATPAPAISTPPATSTSTHTGTGRNEGALVVDEFSVGGAVQRYDALCLDIDNGPDWTVTEDNGGLYSPAGLAACRERLNPGGVLAIWSAQPSSAFEEALRNAGFTSVRTEEIAVARGVPDVVHLAIRGA